MQRELKAAFLLSSLVVAAADRSLLAGKPSGGALHGVALTSSNYFITNGNGTWTFSYYSSATPNGNNAGQNGATYATVNSAYSTAAAATGVKTATAAGIVGTGVAPYSAPPMGLTSIAFPSKNLGVAVGIGAAAAGSTATSPSILLTVDGAHTWMAATGVPSVTLTGASAVTLNPASATTLSSPATPALPAGFIFVGANTAASIVPSTCSVFPASSGGDLTEVYMASKTTGWAIGGNSITLAQATANAGGLVGGIAMGMLYMTTNGGTVWKNVPLFYSQAQFSAASAVASTLAALQNANPKVPGILLGVGADAAGRNVYTVGSPFSSLVQGGSYSGTDGAGTALAFTFPSYYATGIVPTILYSGNSGASWAFQTAPVANRLAYSLLSVAVQKGTTAIAVGGSLTTTGCSQTPTVFASNSGCNGQIIYTNNGGFSWVQASYQSSNNANVPTLNSVAIQTGDIVWAGGFVRSDSFYPTAAESGFTLVNGVTPVANGKTKTDGAGYTILLSVNAGQSFTPLPVSALPPGFVVAGQVPAAGGSVCSGNSITNCNDVFGIVWDNAVRGFIFGNGYILGTNNGGKSWVFEATAVGSTTIGSVLALSNVPTSY